MIVDLTVLSLMNEANEANPPLTVTTTTVHVGLDRAHGLTLETVKFAVKAIRVPRVGSSERWKRKRVKKGRGVKK